MGVRFADFASFFLNIPWKWKTLVSLKPNYFIFIEYLKTGDGEEVWANPLNPLLIRPNPTEAVREHFDSWHFDLCHFDLWLIVCDLWHVAKFGLFLCKPEAMTDGEQRDNRFCSFCIIFFEKCQWVYFDHILTWHFNVWLVTCDFSFRVVTCDYGFWVVTCDYSFWVVTCDSLLLTTFWRKAEIIESEKQKKDKSTFKAIQSSRSLWTYLHFDAFVFVLLKTAISAILHYFSLAQRNGLKSQITIQK